MEEDFKLSIEQMNTLKEKGVIVLKKFIPDELCDRINEEMFKKAEKYFGIKKEDKSSWKNSNHINFLIFFIFLI